MGPQAGAEACAQAAAGRRSPWVYGVASLGLHLALYGAATLWLNSVPKPSPLGLGDRVEAGPLVALGPLEEAAEADGEPAPQPEPLPPPPWSEVDLELLPEALPEQDLRVEPELELPEPAREVALAPLETHLELAGRPSQRPRVPPPAALQEPRPSQPTPTAAPVPRPAPAPPGARPPAREGSRLRALSAPTPTLPEGLVSQGAARVGLLLYVREDGNLGEVRVEASSGQAALDEHVRSFVARTWSFAPTTPPRWVRQSFRIGA